MAVKLAYVKIDNDLRNELLWLSMHNGNMPFNVIIKRLLLERYKVKKSADKRAKETYKDAILKQTRKPSIDTLESFKKYLVNAVNPENKRYDVIGVSKNGMFNKNRLLREIVIPYKYGVELPESIYYNVQAESAKYYVQGGQMLMDAITSMIKYPIKNKILEAAQVKAEDSARKKMKEKKDKDALKYEQLESLNKKIEVVKSEINKLNSEENKDIDKILELYDVHQNLLKEKADFVKNKSKKSKDKTKQDETSVKQSAS